MSKISKTCFVTTLLLFLASDVPSALAQQDGLPCPIGPQVGRTLVLFKSSAPIVASDTLAAALAGPITVSLPAGVYNITASSYDFHSDRQPSQNQPQEQFYLRLSNGQTTNRISDLPEDSNSLTEQIDANFTVTDNITSLTAQHTQYPDPGVPNSIIPVCVAFDDVTPTPTPTPQTSEGGPDDETDCCPGPDPEPEPEPTATPKVAGIQSEAPTNSPTPSIAGAIMNFPSTGFPLKPIASLIALLVSALMIWPAVEKHSSI